MPDLELSHTIASESVGRESRLARDLGAVVGAPAHILCPGRISDSRLQEFGIDPSGVDGEHAVRRQKVSGESHETPQLPVVQEEREKIATRNDQPCAPSKALRWQPVEEVDL